MTALPGFLLIYDGAVLMEYIKSKEKLRMEPENTTVFNIENVQQIYIFSSQRPPFAYSIMLIHVHLANEGIPPKQKSEHKNTASLAGLIPI